MEPGIFCTHNLAQDIYYERTTILAKPWAFRRIYGLSSTKPPCRLVMTPGSAAQDYAAELTGTDSTIVVWCSADEVEDIGDIVTLEEAGETPGSADGPGP